MNWNITAGRPVYVQLVEQLELALVAGEFPPGSRIPPVRELAADAGVNPNTMQRALRSWKAVAFCRRSAPPGAPSQRMTLPCRLCAVGAPVRWRRSFCTRCRPSA